MAYFEEIGRIKLLTIEEERELFKIIESKGPGAQMARDQMITANLRLVIKIARHYESSRLTLSDLISEGNIGLMKAVEKYELGKGAKISTYAAFWIKQAIRRALSDQSRDIRLPVHMVDKITRMRKYEDRLHEELGREPTDDELALEMGLPERKVKKMRESSREPMHLEAKLPNGESDKTTYADVIADPTVVLASDELEAGDNVKTLQSILPLLSRREIFILTKRYNLDYGEKMTLAVIGKQIGLTRERVRQIQNIAIRKLRKAFDKLERKKGPGLAMC